MRTMSVLWIILDGRSCHRFLSSSYTGFYLIFDGTQPSSFMKMDGPTDCDDVRVATVLNGCCGWELPPVLSLGHKIAVISL